jgi:hypothetical protein
LCKDNLYEKDIVDSIIGAYSSGVYLLDCGISRDIAVDGGV